MTTDQTTNIDAAHRLIDALRKFDITGLNDLPPDLIHALAAEITGPAALIEHVSWQIRQEETRRAIQPVASNHEVDDGTPY